MLSSLAKKMYCLFVLSLIFGYPMLSTISAQSLDSSDAESETYTVLTKNFVTGEESIEEHGYEYTRQTSEQASGEGEVLTTPAYFPEEEINENVNNDRHSIGTPHRVHVSYSIYNPFSPLLPNNNKI